MTVWMFCSMTPTLFLSFGSKTIRLALESGRLTIVHPTWGSVLVVKFTGGVVGMRPARATNGARTAPRTAYFHSFIDAAEHRKGSWDLRLLDQPVTLHGCGRSFLIT